MAKRLNTKDLVDKIEKIKIALSVTNNAVEIVDLKQAQVAVIILDAFLLQLRALLGGKLVSLAFLFSPRRALAMILQERFAIVRTPAIGSSGDFHLQHAEVHAQLQFFATIEPSDFEHFNGAALVGPIL